MNINWESGWFVLVWLVITGLVNWAMRTKTPEEWEALAEKNPRYAAFAKVLRSIGLDPVKLIRGIVDFVNAKAPKAQVADKQEKKDDK